MWKHKITAAVASAGMLVSLGLTAAPAHAVDVKPAANSITTKAPASVRQLDRVVELFEALPEPVKRADPRTTPGYRHMLERELSRAAKRLSVGHDHGRVLTTQVNWAMCISSLAWVVAENGVPAVKIVAWIKKARKLWKTVGGIKQAILRGDAVSELGQEASEILQTLVGADDIVAACLA